MDLATDFHVHSTFSDGLNSLAENVQTAQDRAVYGLGCVDHVRRDTEWVPEFVRSVRDLGGTTGMTLTAGLEAKILDDGGLLDLPPAYTMADRIYVADHQFPWRDGPRSPGEIRRWLAEGTLTVEDAVERLVLSTVAAMRRYADHQVVLAHLFSVLPKLGIDEALVPLDAIDVLGSVAADTGTLVEVSERWRCPSLRSARALREAGAQLVSATDSHRASTIGHYDYVARIARELDAGQ